MNAQREPTARPADEVAFERAFEQIHATRMQGLDFLNDALRVEALGFRDWADVRLGVLITPWCINLVLLPGASVPLPTVRPGDAHPWAFPSGIYGFYSHQDPLAGTYAQCSLFSPVTEFAAQEDAVAAAQAALDALLTAPAPAVEATPPPPRLTRRGLLSGS